MRVDEHRHRVFRRQERCEFECHERQNHKQQRQVQPKVLHSRHRIGQFAQPARHIACARAKPTTQTRVKLSFFRRTRERERTIGGWFVCVSFLGAAKVLRESPAVDRGQRRHRSNAGRVCFQAKRSTNVHRAAPFFVRTAGHNVQHRILQNKTGK